MNPITRSSQIFPIDRNEDHRVSGSPNDFHSSLRASLVIRYVERLQANEREVNTIIRR